jgi:hypothetical protein
MRVASWSRHVPADPGRLPVATEDEGILGGHTRGPAWGTGSRRVPHPGCGPGPKFAEFGTPSKTRPVGFPRSRSGTARQRPCIVIDPHVNRDNPGSNTLCKGSGPVPSRSCPLKSMDRTSRGSPQGAPGSAFPATCLPCWGPGARPDARPGRLPRPAFRVPGKPPPEHWWHDPWFPWSPVSRMGTTLHQWLKVRTGSAVPSGDGGQTDWEMKWLT